VGVRRDGRRHLERRSTSSPAGKHEILHPTSRTRTLYIPCFPVPILQGLIGSEIEKFYVELRIRWCQRAVPVLSAFPTNISRWKLAHPTATSATMARSIPSRQCELDERAPSRAAESAVWDEIERSIRDAPAGATRLRWTMRWNSSSSRASLPQSGMLIPEAWRAIGHGRGQRAFTSSASLMEPWMDRRGIHRCADWPRSTARPGPDVHRDQDDWWCWLEGRDRRAAEDVAKKALQPGRMFCDTVEHRSSPTEIKKTCAVSLTPMLKQQQVGSSMPEPCV